MIAPIGIPSDPDQESDQDPEDSLPRLSESESDQWEEHQRRQKSIRTLMMFLMMLILMEGENPPDSNRKKMLRAKRKNGDVKKETMNRNRDLLEYRRSLDKLLGSVIRLPLAPISGSVMNSEAGTTYVQASMKSQGHCNMLLIIGHIFVLHKQSSVPMRNMEMQKVEQSPMVRVMTKVMLMLMLYKRQKIFMTML